jgi:hypothetical protein
MELEKTHHRHAIGFKGGEGICYVVVVGTAVS